MLSKQQFLFPERYKEEKKWEVDRREKWVTFANYLIHPQNRKAIHKIRKAHKWPHLDASFSSQPSYSQISACSYDHLSLLCLCLGRFWNLYWHNCFVVMFTMPAKQTTLALKLALLWPAWWVTLGLPALRFPTLTQGCFPASVGRSVYTHSQASLGWALSTAPGNSNLSPRTWSGNRGWAWRQVFKTLPSIGGPGDFSVVGFEHNSRTSTNQIFWSWRLNHWV